MYIFYVIFSDLRGIVLSFKFILRKTVKTGFQDYLYKV